FSETGIGWVPEHLGALDHLYLRGKSEREGRLMDVMRAAMAPLRMTPSEYFRRNCYLGASVMPPDELRVRDQVGVDRIMWGVDYPHAEGCYPFAREAMQLTFHGVPELETRAMLGATAADVYHFDYDFLQSIADRVGPAVAQMQEPLPDERVPRVPEDTYSSVFEAAAAGRGATTTG